METLQVVLLTILVLVSLPFWIGPLLILLFVGFVTVLTPFVFAWALIAACWERLK